MKEIIPGIYYMRLPTAGFPPGHANAYLVRGDNTCTLIDTGWDTPEIHDYIKQELHGLGIEFKDISRILLTHPHTDHAGLAGVLRKRYGIPIYLHQDGIPAIKFRFELIDGQYTDTFINKTDILLKTHGVPPEQLSTAEKLLPEMRSPPFPDVTLTGSELIDTGNYKFEVISTPGHAPGHVAFYEPERQLLIAGDNVLPGLTTNVGFHLQLNSNPLGDYLHSLQILKRLAVKLVLPGHEEPFAHLHRRIDELVRKHEVKNGSVLKTFPDGTPRTAYEVSLAVSWSPSQNRATWLDFTPWDKRFTMLENIAHLQALVFSGKLEKSTEDGIIYYQLSWSEVP